MWPPGAALRQKSPLHESSCKRSSWLTSLSSFLCSSRLSDLDKMDSEKEEMNQADIAALHHFYSKHISDLPDEHALTELFAQVD